MKKPDFRSWTKPKSYVKCPYCGQIDDAIDEELASQIEDCGGDFMCYDCGGFFEVYKTVRFRTKKIKESD